MPVSMGVRRCMISAALLVFMGCQGSNSQPSAPASSSPRVAPAMPNPPTIPAVSEVANIRLTSLGSSLGAQYDVDLTRGPDIAALVGWLKRIDWTPARAHDQSNVGLAHVGRIIVRKKDGAEQSFALSGGSVIIGRWGWDADTDELAAIATRARAEAPPK